jgi:hypothetical protein
MSDHDRDRLKVVSDEPLSVKKPDEFDFDAFRSTHDPSIANVATLLTALPHYRIADAKDFVRLHPNETTHWSPELCFVNVPIKGQKQDTLHLITEQLAELYLPSNRIERFRLALATKPHDVPFLCHVPSRNLDNSWNDTNSKACCEAKTNWTLVTSRKPEGIESYKITYARDGNQAFPEPNWPAQSLKDLIQVTFAGRMITSEDHPALLRLIGAKQSLK